jgi:4-hydroxythreonine-4-phosphate dehydrogenase
MPGDATLPLALTMGDPAGVGPQIAWLCWDRLRRTAGRPFFLLADPDHMRRIQGAGPLAIIRSESEATAAFADALPVLPLREPLPEPVLPGRPLASSVPAILDAIRMAVASCQAGRAAAVVTNPISKALVMAAGFPHPGHTEFLGELASAPGHPAPLPVMMLAGGGLRVALATIHRPLASVPGLLNEDLILRTGRILDTDLRARFGLAAPRIGLCGLNPHAGEDGVLGREEIDIINPAAARLRVEGVDISNARPGDTIFHEMREGRFDAILALYHDQGLIPVKTLDLWGGVNVTLGLPFIRTSPDHGTAYDAAGAGTARPDSLLAALALADHMASQSVRRP